MTESKKWDSDMTNEPCSCPDCRRYAKLVELLPALTQYDRGEVERALRTANNVGYPSPLHLVAGSMEAAVFAPPGAILPGGSCYYCHRPAKWDEAVMLLDTANHFSGAAMLRHCDYHKPSLHQKGHRRGLRWMTWGAPSEEWRMAAPDPSPIHRLTHWIRETVSF